MSVDHASGVATPMTDPVFLHVRAGMTVIVEDGNVWRMADVIWVDGGARNPKVPTLFQIADVEGASTGPMLTSSPTSFQGSDMHADLVSNDVLRPDNVVSFFGMKLASLAYIGGGVTVAVMFLAVFIGGAKAGIIRSQSADAPAAKGHH